MYGIIGGKRTVKMRWVALILAATVCFATAVCLAGRGSTKIAKKEIAREMKPFLVGLEQLGAVPSPVACSVPIPSALSSNDFADIKRLIGRIPRLTYTILELEAFWDDCPTAARARLSNVDVYMVNSHGTNWEIERIIRKQN
jgi:hypothetical protein